MGWRQYSEQLGGRGQASQLGGREQACQLCGREQASQLGGREQSRAAWWARTVEGTSVGENSRGQLGGREQSRAAWWERAGQGGHVCAGEGGLGGRGRRLGLADGTGWLHVWVDEALGGLENTHSDNLGKWAWILNLYFPICLILDSFRGKDLHRWLDRWLDGWMHGWMDGADTGADRRAEQSADGWMDGQVCSWTVLHVQEDMKAA
eukprot:347878-Chlamydomonas_euryale.AAC.4